MRADDAALSRENIRAEIKAVWRWCVYAYGFSFLFAGALIYRFFFYGAAQATNHGQSLKEMIVIVFMISVVMIISWFSLIRPLQRLVSARNINVTARGAASTIGRAAVRSGVELGIALAFFTVVFWNSDSENFWLLMFQFLVLIGLMDWMKVRRLKAVNSFFGDVEPSWNNLSPDAA